LIAAPGFSQMRTSAWPLALLYAGLILYASLYPFSGWRVQGVEPWSWLTAPWPQYWTAFDLYANFLGYVPLGFLIAVAVLRLGGRRGAWWVLGGGLPMLLSAGVESAQTYLLMRVASNVDFGLNTAGGALGCGLAWLANRAGLLQHWGRWRESWFDPRAHGSLVLLAAWPLALLYPLSIPFGLGQAWERLADALAEWMGDTPFVHWLPDPGLPVDPLSPLTEAFCVALGLLAPLLMAYGDMRFWWRRLVFAAVFLAGAWAIAGLSGALTYGPAHAWAWATEPAIAGLVGAGVAALACAPLSRRLCHALMLLCLGMSLALLNRAPEVPYFAQSIQVWEQGRFIRFHGVSQWLGWLWPYAAIAFGLGAVARSSGHAEARA
jgi:VanZ family protein